MRTLAYYLFSKNGASLVICAGILLLASGCEPATRNKPSPPSNTSFPPAAAYSQLGWIDDRNERWRLIDYSGKVLVLDFYATWCEPCRRSIPRLNALKDLYGSKGLEIVGLNVGGPDDRVKVDRFARDLSIRYTLGFPDKSLTDFFLEDDQTIPQTFVFDRDGNLTKRFVGYGGTTAEELDAAIQFALQKERESVE